MKPNRIIALSILITCLFCICLAWIFYSIRITSTTTLNKASSISLLLRAIQDNYNIEYISNILRMDPSQVYVLGVDDWSPLYSAVFHERIAVVKELIRRHAPLNQRAASDGTTALHMAVLRDNTEIVVLLLEAGIDTTIRDNNGNTASELARKRSKNDVSELIEAGKKTGHHERH